MICSRNIGKIFERKNKLIDIYALAGNKRFFFLFLFVNYEKQSGRKMALLNNEIDLTKDGWISLEWPNMFRMGINLM